MLRNDTVQGETIADGIHKRALQREVKRHHRNNPHSSMEAAFEYIMSISSTYRALPIACIEKARRYLALPLDKKSMGSTDISERILPHRWTSNAFMFGDRIVLEEPTKFPNGHIPLNGQQTVDYLVGLTNDLASIRGISIHDKPSLVYIFNTACGQLSGLKNLRTENVIEARQILGLSTALIESMGMPLYSVEFHIDVPYPGSSSMSQKEQTEPGTTVVHAERVVKNGKKMIKILEFENVYSANGVPVDYLKEPPYYILERDVSTKYILLTVSDYLIDSMVIKVDDILSLKDFGQMIKTMKEAGVRLSKINKTAKLEKEHSGKFTVSI